MKDKKESVYFSNRRAPLGKSHDQTPGLPKGLDLLNTTFGTAIVRGSENKGWEGVIKCFLRKWDSVSYWDLFSAGADDVRNERIIARKLLSGPEALELMYVKAVGSGRRAETLQLQERDSGTLRPAVRAAIPSPWASTDGFYFHQCL